MQAFDALIIGMEQAGPSLAARLSKAGMRVAAIEREHFGGTCVNNGCTPTKAMVASAYAAHVARRATEYGVVMRDEPTVDMRQVKARREQIVQCSRTGLERWIEGLHGVTVYHGHARFVGARDVRVGTDVLTAPRIFVNVGGRPLVPNLPGVDTVPISRT